MVPRCVRVMAYETFPVRDIHVAASVAAADGTPVGLLDDLGRVELQALLAAVLIGGCARVEGLLLAKVGAVIVLVRIRRDGSGRAGLGGLLGTLEECGQICQGLLNRLCLLGLVCRLRLVGQDLGLGELLRPLLRRCRGIAHLNIFILGRREHAAVGRSRADRLEQLDPRPGLATLHQGLHDLVVSKL